MTSGEDVATITVEADGTDRISVPLKGVQQFAVAYSPQSQCTIGTSGESEATIRAEANRVNLVSAPLKGVLQFAAFYLPKPQCRVTTPRKRQAAKVIIPKNNT